MSFNVFRTKVLIEDTVKFVSPHGDENNILMVI